MSNVIKYIKNNYLKMVLYLLIVLSIVLMIVIKVINPLKNLYNTVYDENEVLKIEKVSFPLVQNIKLNKSNLNLITIYFSDDSINMHDYTISVLDEDKNILFNHEYLDYESNIVLIDAGFLKRDTTYELVVECDSCDDVQMAIGKSIDDKNEIIGTNGKALKLTVNSYENNNNYYWYPLIIIAISFTLLPLIRSKENEKK